MMSLAWFSMTVAVGVLGFFLRRLIKTHDEKMGVVQEDLRVILREVRLTNGRVIALEVWKGMHTHTPLENDIRELRHMES